MSRGVFVETLETATTWTQLTDLHDAVAGALRTALARRGTPARRDVPRLAPLSDRRVAVLHVPRPPQPGDELAQWQAAKQAASEAISAAGATITHHHAVGRDHAPWLQAEVGELGVAALKAVKDRVDPAGVMNPGKLLG